MIKECHGCEEKTRFKKKRFYFSRMKMVHQDLRRSQEKITRGCRILKNKQQPGLGNIYNFHIFTGQVSETSDTKLAHKKKKTNIAVDCVFQIFN